MSSVIELSLDVIQRFNPSEEEIVGLINELQLLISVKTPCEEIKQKSEDEIGLEEFENWFRSRPKIKISSIK